MLFFSTSIYNDMNIKNKIFFLKGSFSDISIFYADRDMQGWNLQSMFFCSLLDIITTYMEIPGYEILISNIVNSLAYILNYTASYANHIEIEEIATKSIATPAA